MYSNQTERLRFFKYLIDKERLDQIAVIISFSIEANI